MSDRVNFYFRQRVTEAELDLAFALLERADRNLIADLGIHGIIMGAEPAEHQPVADLSIDLVAPARAYDRLGQRIFVGTDQVVDLSVDHTGIPTEVTTSGNERWLAVFLRFDRKLDDPRTDGNSQQVFFRQAESFEIVVRQSPEEPIGEAEKVATVEDELLVCDVRRRFEQTQIRDADIEPSRRQSIVFAPGDTIKIISAVWNVLRPTANNVQAALNEVDAELSDHFTGSARRHAATDVAYEPNTYLESSNLQEALDELLDGLSSSSSEEPGAEKIGASLVSGDPKSLEAGNVGVQLGQLLSWLNEHIGSNSDAHPTTAISASVVGGSPHSLPNGPLQLHLGSLLSFINNHINDPTAAHSAKAISATSHNHITGNTVQDQLTEIVDDLESQNSSLGASKVGSAAIPGTPTNLSAGTVRSQLSTLLFALNNHQSVDSSAHQADTITIADNNANLNATNVESALTEIFDAYAKGHYRQNQDHAGQHSVIIQPSLGNGRVLLWEAVGSGSASARFRIHADEDAIWFTFNAAWSGSTWEKDATDIPAGGFRFSPSLFELFHEDSGAATFTDWLRTWQLPMSSTVNSAFEMTGGVRETGRIGMKATNTHTANRTVDFGGVVTFRNRFPAAPSSITLLKDESNPSWEGMPSVLLADRDGFAYSMSQELAPQGVAYWYGRYIAIA